MVIVGSTLAHDVFWLFLTERSSVKPRTFLTDSGARGQTYFDQTRIWLVSSVVLNMILKFVSVYSVLQNQRSLEPESKPLI